MTDTKQRWHSAKESIKANLPWDIGLAAVCSLFFNRKDPKDLLSLRELGEFSLTSVGFSAVSGIFGFIWPNKTKQSSFSPDAQQRAGAVILEEGYAPLERTPGVSYTAVEDVRRAAPPLSGQSTQR